MDLGKAPSELRVLGCDGLSLADEDKTSYTFLAVADPATRAGVVAGWLTHNRGSGVVLSKADRSFVPHKGQGFRAVNKEGYLVDLVKPEPKNIMAIEPRRMGDAGDLVAAEIRNLHWLVSSPKFTQIVIGDDGYPAAMTCPDPRAFALHKIWLSERADRDPLKKKRDRHQGLTVAYLIARYLPQFRFNAEELRMFPKNVFDRAGQEISKLDVPPEFG